MGPGSHSARLLRMATEIDAISNRSSQEGAEGNA